MSVLVGADHERNFWRCWLEREGHRYITPRALDRRFDAWIDGKTRVHIANLGAGAVNLLGEVKPGVDVFMNASDLLADDYQVMRETLGLELYTPVTKQDMRTLTYGDETFDVVYCANALDHCADPVQAIRECIRVVKPGGWIYLRHMAHEGARLRYSGLHQWNLDPTSDGDCEIWNRDRSVVCRLTDIDRRFMTRTDGKKVVSELRA